MTEILNEINRLKETIKFNEIMIPTVQHHNKTSIPVIITAPSEPHLFHSSTSSLTASLIPTSKLIIYDNPIHHAIIKQEQQQQQNNSTIPITIVSAALDGVNSVTNMIKKKLLNSSSNDNSSSFTPSNESSSSSPPSPSLTYSSEATINLVNLKSNNKVKNLAFKS